MKNAWINILLVLTSTALVFVVLEAGLRLSGYSLHTHTITRLGREKVVYPLPGIRYLYKGHTSFTQVWPDDPRDYFDTSDNSILYRLNNYGFRGDDFAIRRNHRVRIAVIGDSFCWGAGVKEEDRFTAVVEEKLNWEKILGQEYEVYNFCLSGFNTVSEVALYEQVILYFQPDLLLISYFLNDVNLPPYLFFWWRPWRPDYLKEWRERFRLVDWVVSRISVSQARPAFVASVNAAYERGHPGYESVVDGFGRLAHLNRRQDVPTVLVIFPWMVELEQESYPFHQAHQAIQQAGEEQGFEVLDLFGVFVGHKAEELQVHTTDYHPNEAGHRMAAEAIYTRLADVLTRSGDNLLAEAARRRLTPVPPDLHGPLEKEWYKVFATFSTHEMRSDTPPPSLP